MTAAESIIRPHAYLAAVIRGGGPDRCYLCLALREHPAHQLGAAPAPVPAIHSGACCDRDETIAAIRAALRRRTGRPWSVTGGRGTAWGWIKVSAPPSRMTWHYHLPDGAPDAPESYIGSDTGEPGGYMTPADCAELARALGLERVHSQGESIPAGHDYRAEYIDRAEGREPSRVGVPYWD